MMSSFLFPIRTEGRSACFSFQLHGERTTYFKFGGEFFSLQEMSIDGNDA